MSRREELEAEGVPGSLDGEGWENGGQAGSFQ